MSSAAAVILKGFEVVQGAKGRQRRKDAARVTRALKRARFAQKRRLFLQQFRAVQQEQLLAGSREGGLRSSGFQGSAASTATELGARLGEFEDQTRQGFLADEFNRRAERFEANAEQLKGASSFAGSF